MEVWLWWCEKQRWSTHNPNNNTMQHNLNTVVGLDKWLCNLHPPPQPPPTSLTHHSHKLNNSIHERKEQPGNTVSGPLLSPFFSFPLLFSVNNGFSDQKTIYQKLTDDADLIAAILFIPGFSWWLEVVSAIRRGSYNPPHFLIDFPLHTTYWRNEIFILSD